MSIVVELLKLAVIRASSLKSWERFNEVHAYSQEEVTARLLGSPRWRRRRQARAGGRGIRAVSVRSFRPAPVKPPKHQKRRHKRTGCCDARQLVLAAVLRLEALQPTFTDLVAELRPALSQAAIAAALRRLHAEGRLRSVRGGWCVVYPTTPKEGAEGVGVIADGLAGRR